LATIVQLTGVCRRRLSSSVTLPAGGPSAAHVGGRHCTAGQYGHVPLGRHLVHFAKYLNVIFVGVVTYYWDSVILFYCHIYSMVSCFPLWLVNVESLLMRLLEQFISQSRASHRCHIIFCKTRRQQLLLLLLLAVNCGLLYAAFVTSLLLLLYIVNAGSKRWMGMLIPRGNVPQPLQR